MEKLEYPHTLYLEYVPPVYRHCRLDNFDFTGQKRTIAKTLTDFIEGEIPGLYFFGGFGCGKTHLLVSLYRVMVAKEDETSFSVFPFITFDELLRDLKYCKNETEKDETIEMLCNADILFLDDITTCQPKDVDILRRIINSRYENQGRTCFTANSGTKFLSDEVGLHPHAVSRLDSIFEFVEIVGSDHRVGTRRRKK